MQASPLSPILLLGVFATLLLTPRAQETARGANLGPDIYDETADCSQQIADSVAAAKKEDKHVLLQFGANWCIWCHRLHHLLETDPGLAAEIKSNYEVVLVDVNKDHNADINAKYGKPTRLGLPVLVVLDGDGRQLTTEDSGKLEEGDHHAPQKVMDFLKTWAPTK